MEVLLLLSNLSSKKSAALLAFCLNKCYLPVCSPCSWYVPLGLNSFWLFHFYLYLLCSFHRLDSLFYSVPPNLHPLQQSAIYEFLATSSTTYLYSAHTACGKPSYTAEGLNCMSLNQAQCAWIHHTYLPPRIL